jgi:hypothetical protein
MRHSTTAPIFFGADDGNEKESEWCQSCIFAKVIDLFASN